MAKRKFYVIRNKRGVGGVSLTKPSPVKQASRFAPECFYAVVFFPKIKGIGGPVLYKGTVAETISITKKAAIAKFMDRGNIDKPKPKREIWSTYVAAGWKVRRIRITDLGDR